MARVEELLHEMFEAGTPRPPLSSAEEKFAAFIEQLQTLILFEFFSPWAPIRSPKAASSGKAG